VLEAAETWGKAPWEIAPGGLVLWFERWKAYRAAKINVDKQREMERKAQAQTRRR